MGSRRSKEVEKWRKTERHRDWEGREREERTRWRGLGGGRNEERSEKTGQRHKKRSKGERREK